MLFHQKINSQCRTACFRRCKHLRLSRFIFKALKQFMFLFFCVWLIYCATYFLSCKVKMPLYETRFASAHCRPCVVTIWMLQMLTRIVRITIHISNEWSSIGDILVFLLLMNMSVRVFLPGVFTQIARAKIIFIVTYLLWFSFAYLEFSCTKYILFLVNIFSAHGEYSDTKLFVLITFQVDPAADWMEGYPSCLNIALWVHYICLSCCLTLTAWVFTLPLESGRGTGFSSNRNTAPDPCRYSFCYSHLWNYMHILPQAIRSTKLLHSLCFLKNSISIHTAIASETAQCRHPKGINILVLFYINISNNLFDYT